MKGPTTIQQLRDEARCEHPDCDGKHETEAVVLNPRCHLGAGLRVVYDPESNLMRFACNTCRAPVLTLSLSLGEVS